MKDKHRKKIPKTVETEIQKQISNRQMKKKIEKSEN